MMGIIQIQMIKIQLYSRVPQKNRQCLMVEHNTNQDTNSTMLGLETLSVGVWKLSVLLSFMHFSLCIHFVVPLCSSFTSPALVPILIVLVTLILLFVWGTNV